MMKQMNCIITPIIQDLNASMVASFSLVGVVHGPLAAIHVKHQFRRYSHST
jgi:hypothetical protein